MKYLDDQSLQPLPPPSPLPSSPLLPCSTGMDQPLQPLPPPSSLSSPLLPCSTGMDQPLQPLPPPSPLLSSPFTSPHLTSPPLLSSPPPPLQYRDGSVAPASSHSCWLSRGWQWPDSPGPWLGTLHGSSLQIRSLLSLQTPSGKGVGEGREEHEALVLNHVPHN